MGRRRPPADCLYKRDRKGGKPQPRPRVSLSLRTTTVAFSTIRNQEWRKRKHKGEAIHDY